MANETTTYAGLYYCEKCHKTKPEKDFYSSHNLEKYPTGKLKQCKACLTMHVDNWDPNTYTWILEECDLPYIPQVWTQLMQKYAKNPEKVTGATILGRYIGNMRLKQYRDYRWSDNEFIQELERQKIESTMKMAGGYSAADIEQAVLDARKQELPDRPLEPTAPDLSISGIYEDSIKEEDSITKDLTEEDRTYLRIKWGKTYKPEEWIQLEKLYNDMMQSYDIQTAGHIDTLKFICKTSLKANQLLDLGDVDGAQKMLKMYDSMMKSGHFTQAQAKEKSEEMNSISEIVSICEAEGYIPRYYIEEPNDKIDKIILDMQNYTKTLITEEMGLGAMIERLGRQLEEEQAAKEANAGKDEILDDEDLTPLTAENLIDLLDEEDKWEDDE